MVPKSESSCLLSGGPVEDRRWRHAGGTIATIAKTTTLEGSGCNEQSVVIVEVVVVLPGS